MNDIRYKDLNVGDILYNLNKEFDESIFILLDKVFVNKYSYTLTWMKIDEFSKTYGISKQNSSWNGLIDPWEVL